METWVNVSSMRWWTQASTLHVREYFEVSEFLQTHNGKDLYQTEMEIRVDGIYMKFKDLETATLFKLKFS